MCEYLGREKPRDATYVRQILLVLGVHQIRFRLGQRVRDVGDQSQSLRVVGHCLTHMLK